MVKSTLSAAEEQALIDRVDAADAAELAEILQRPSADEDHALRAYLGDTRYERQRELTLRRSIRQASIREPVGNVVVLPGIMGSQLSSVARAGPTERVWIKILRIVSGGLGCLRLAEDGLREREEGLDVRPTGILKRHYGDLLLSLAATWRVRAFWFDWRKDLEVAADKLEADLQGWFARGEPVHLVAHSMGGLVARMWIRRYREHWKQLQGQDSPGGRLVMLGTPNHGSFAIPQVIAGIEGLVKKLALVDLRHSPLELQRIFNSFPGIYDMLPSPFVQEERWRDLYHERTYDGVDVFQRHLDAAHRHHEMLADVVEPERLVYVAGANQLTLGGVKVTEVGDPRAYEVTRNGDGRVPHTLGLLEGVSTYYVEASHGDLTVNTEVLRSLDSLLQTGGCELSTTPPTARTDAAPHRDLAETPVAFTQADEERVRRLASVVSLRTGDPTEARTGPVERELEEQIVGGFLSTLADEPRPPASIRAPQPIPIRIALAHSKIESAEKLGGESPVDAIAVGHYIGVRPQEAELALDRAISAHLLPGRKAGKRARHLLLTEYTERGIIRGELGEPFFLEDPRDQSSEAPVRRLIALAGMGLPGRFGAPELTVLARELCWALGRLGKRHLATVLIGGGAGNIPTATAVEAWLRGLSDALTGTPDPAASMLRQLTFVETSAARLASLQEAIEANLPTLERNGLAVSYEPLESSTLKDAVHRERRYELRALGRDPSAGGAGGDDNARPAPTRLTLTLDKGVDEGVYTFGAITQEAALPERAIPLDPRLVEQANDELAGEWRPEFQWERGRLLDRLLIPDDLRPHLAGNAPVVMLLDATTARIHWEMVALSEPKLMRSNRDDGNEPTRDPTSVFLGTSRGLTRQLRTTFAPPPEPPPPPRRELSVLVVADPAADDPLQGAEEEGVAVADVFESLNDVAALKGICRVRVVRLLGPHAATRTAVLRHLAVHSYDVLHYAGHCAYDEANPAKQGWVFTGGTLLSPNELTRIDRVPKFVFSNACESGVTPDRSGERDAGLAPSFAEAFFARGVANFVCTAWPINDSAAREFAIALYAGLLGVPVPDGTSQINRDLAWRPKEMYEAMRDARRRIFDAVGGIQTWGAYQHYGNPYFRLFDPPEEDAT